MEDLAVILVGLCVDGGRVYFGIAFQVLAEKCSEQRLPVGGESEFLELPHCFLQGGESWIGGVFESNLDHVEILL